MTRGARRTAFVLALSLVVLAACAGVVAAWLEFTLSPSESLDSSRAGFDTAAAFAAAFCLGALRQLTVAGRGRTGILGATACFGLAVLALFALVAVAFASRLGG